MSAEELERQYERARADEQCVLLVCDAVAEEGWNLQFIREVLHLDVPWSANRLEQRLGRFDRFALGGDANEPVLSTVVLDAEPFDAVTGAWTQLLDDGFEVFTKSSATLQYALPEREEVALARAIDAGFAAMAANVEREREELSALRRHIEGQDLLDAVDDTDEERRFFQQLTQVDRASKALDEAVSNWIGKALNFSESFADGMRRFNVSKRNPPLLQESEIHRIGLEHFNWLYAVRRQNCGKQGVRLLRPGQPLLDAVFDLCRRDGRGTTFAGALEVAGLPAEASTMPVFFFDVLIEAVIAEDAPIEAVERMALQRQTLKHLPIAVEPIWLVPGRGEPPPALRTQLERMWTKDLGTDARLFHELTEGMDWPATCRAAEADATDRILARSHFAENLERARRSIDQEEARVVAQSAARTRALNEPFDEAAIAGRFNLIRDAVNAPRVRTDSCGVVLAMRPGD